MNGKIKKAMDFSALEQSDEQRESELFLTHMMLGKDLRCLNLGYQGHTQNGELVAILDTEPATLRSLTYETDSEWVELWHRNKQITMSFEDFRLAFLETSERPGNYATAENHNH